MRRGKLLILILLCIMGINQVSGKTIVRVAAAANLRYVMEEIEKVYEAKNAEIDLQINYGASGTFYQQIVNGAPFNLFLSADNILPSKLKDANITLGEDRAYACGKLAIYSLSKDMKTLKMDALKDKSLKRIAIGNPRTAPYGSRSVDLLKAMGLWTDLQKKLVIGDSIAQAAQFAMSGNADLGFVALSLLLNPEVTLKGSYYIIPESDYKPIEQSGVIIKQKAANKQAEDFFKFILSENCQKIWEKYGYSPAQ